mgnify:CR=1 FL=1
MVSMVDDLASWLRLEVEARGWSLRDLSTAISEAHESATGLPVRLAPRLLSSVEERNALISYATLCWIGSGLDCNPVEILLEDPPGVPSAAS